MVLGKTGTISMCAQFEQIYPGLEIVGIYGGQSCACAPSPCLMGNGSFVMLKFKKTCPQATCWESFNALMRSLTGSDTIGLNDSEDPWINVEITKSVFSELVFRIRGRNVIPANLGESSCSPQKSRFPAAT